jgi:hypothetical protein
MDAFSKIRKTAGREEQKRQMINKAIDLLHKLANKRLDFDEAKSEISRVVSEYYVIDDTEGVEGNDKINLELMMNNAFDVISGVKDEKLNLYQAIMLMNKVMAHTEVKKGAESKKIEVAIPEIKESVKVDIKERLEQKSEAKQVKMEEKEDTFGSLMNKVIENKRKYQQSIEELNELLKSHGFLLNTLEPK